MNPIVDAVLGVVSGPLDKILGRFFPNADDRQKAMLEIQAEIQKSDAAIIKAALDANAAQIEVNKVEAASASLFVAGWRPACGWVCVFGMAWQYVIQPMLTWGMAAWAAHGGKVLPPLPLLDNSQMFVLLSGMLGLGAARTIEKIRGEVDRSTLKEP